MVMQDICNKFIEINFCVGCMVLQPNRLFQRSTTMSLINKKDMNSKYLGAWSWYGMLSCLENLKQKL